MQGVLLYFISYGYFVNCVPGSSLGIATDYGLDGPDSDFINIASSYRNFYIVDVCDTADN